MSPERVSFLGQLNSYNKLQRFVFEFYFEIPHQQNKIIPPFKHLFFLMSHSEVFCKIGVLKIETKSLKNTRKKKLHILVKLQTLCLNSFLAIFQRFCPHLKQFSKF